MEGQLGETLVRYQTVTTAWNPRLEYGPECRRLRQAATICPQVYPHSVHKLRLCDSVQPRRTDTAVVEIRSTLYKRASIQYGSQGRAHRPLSRHFGPGFLGRPC